MTSADNGGRGGSRNASNLRTIDFVDKEGKGGGSKNPQILWMSFMEVLLDVCHSK